VTREDQGPHSLNRHSAARPRSTSSRFTFLRCENGARTFPYWSSTSSPSTPSAPASASMASRPARARCGVGRQERRRRDDGDQPARVELLPRQAPRRLSRPPYVACNAVTAGVTVLADALKNPAKRSI